MCFDIGCHNGPGRGVTLNVKSSCVVCVHLKTVDDVCLSVCIGWNKALIYQTLTTDVFGSSPRLQFFTISWIPIQLPPFLFMSQRNYPSSCQLEASISVWSLIVGDLCWIRMISCISLSTRNFDLSKKLLSFCLSPSLIFTEYLSLCMSQRNYPSLCQLESSISIWLLIIGDPCLIAMISCFSLSARIR